MQQNVQGPQPGGIQPQGPGPAQPAQFPSTGSGGDFQASAAAWNQMFGGKASADELKAIMNGVLQDSVNQIKRDQQRAIKAIRDMKKVAEGQE